VHHMRTTKAADGAFIAQGIEIGSGFSGARMLGSEHNDEFFMSPDGEVRTRTNRCGPCLPSVHKLAGDAAGPQYKP